MERPRGNVGLFCFVFLFLSAAGNSANQQETGNRDEDGRHLSVSFKNHDLSIDLEFNCGWQLLYAAPNDGEMSGAY